MTEEQIKRLEVLKRQRHYTVSDIYERDKLERIQLKEKVDAHTITWGRWKYDGSDPPSVVLLQYEIVLERIRTSGQLGNWLLHLREKNWVTADDLGQLVIMVTDLARIGYLPIKRRKETV